MSKKNIILFLISIFCFLLFGYFLQETLQYALFWREQQQLFLFDKSYIAEILCRPSGLVVLSSSFLVQFFYSPVLAVLLTLALLVLISLFVWLAVR